MHSLLRFHILSYFYIFFAWFCQLLAMQFLKCFGSRTHWDWIFPGSLIAYRWFNWPDFFGVVLFPELFWFLFPKEKYSILPFFRWIIIGAPLFVVPLLDLEGVSVKDFELVRHITRVVVVGALDFTMNLEINEMCSVFNSDLGSYLKLGGKVVTWVWGSGGGQNFKTDHVQCLGGSLDIDFYQYQPVPASTGTAHAQFSKFCKINAA